MQLLTRCSCCGPGIDHFRPRNALPALRRRVSPTLARLTSTVLSSLPPSPPFPRPRSSSLKLCCRRHADRPPRWPQSTPQECAPSIPAAVCPRHARRARHLARSPLFGTISPPQACLTAYIASSEPLLYVPLVTFRPRPSGPLLPPFPFCSPRAVAPSVLVYSPHRLASARGGNHEPLLRKPFRLRALPQDRTLVTISFLTFSVFRKCGINLTPSRVLT
jgi:hypothetical protein